MEIQNRILEIVNDYDYKNDVEKAVNEYKQAINNKEFVNCICLDAKIDSQFIGNNEGEIAQKVSSQIIEYRIKEKAFVKLMSEGLIYPIGTCDGWENRSVKYFYRNITSSSHLNFRRIVFTNFMIA